MRDMNFIELLFFVLLPGGALICAIMFAWDQIKRYEDEIEYLKEKGKNRDYQQYKNFQNKEEE